MRPSRFRRAGLTVSHRRQKLKPASSLRLRRRYREAGRFARTVQMPLRFKPVGLREPDRATSRQPEIVCEPFDRPDITSFLRTWVFVTQIRIIVHLASCMDFVPGFEKVTQPGFPQIGRQQCRTLRTGEPLFTASLRSVPIGDNAFAADPLRTLVRLCRVVPCR